MAKDKDGKEKGGLLGTLKSRRARMGGQLGDIMGDLRRGRGQKPQDEKRKPPKR